MAASPVPQALRVLENLSALQPQPMLCSTPGARLHFANPLATSPCSHRSAGGCVHAACSRVSLAALLLAAPGPQREEVVARRGAAR